MRDAFAQGEGSAFGPVGALEAQFIQPNGAGDVAAAVAATEQGQRRLLQQGRFGTAFGGVAAHDDPGEGFPIGHDRIGIQLHPGLGGAAGDFDTGFDGDVGAQGNDVQAGVVVGAVEADGALPNVQRLAPGAVAALVGVNFASDARAAFNGELSIQARCQAIALQGKVWA